MTWLQVPTTFPLIGKYGSSVQVAVMQKFYLGAPGLKVFSVYIQHWKTVLQQILFMFTCIRIIYMLYSFSKVTD